MLNITKLTSR